MTSVCCSAFKRFSLTCFFICCFRNWQFFSFDSCYFFILTVNILVQGLLLHYLLVKSNRICPSKRSLTIFVVYHHFHWFKFWISIFVNSETRLYTFLQIILKKRPNKLRHGRTNHQTQFALVADDFVFHLKLYRANTNIIWNFN